MIYTPDKWIVLEIKEFGEKIYKVLAGFDGVYTNSGSWRINSGIISVEQDENWIKFHGYSGSCYVCGDDRYGTNPASHMILGNLLQLGTKFEVMSEDTRWLMLFENKVHE